MTEPFDTYLREALQRGYIAAYRILGNPDESQEACQEAAAKALVAYKQYDPSRPFYPWFYRILKNHCLDQLRQRKKTVPQAHIETTEPQKSAESQLVEHEYATILQQAIEQLSDEHREVIELRHFQDLRYEDMAEILNLPEGTVMSRLYRARKALRQLLQDTPIFPLSSKRTKETAS